MTLQDQAVDSDDLAVIAGICGGQVLDCFCDPLCTHFGDCCDGYHAACVQLPSPVPVPTTPLPPYPPLSECQLSTIAGDLNDDSVVDVSVLPLIGFKRSLGAQTYR